MILMWLGSFVLMLAGMMYSQQLLAKLLSGLQKSFLDKGLEGGLSTLFVRSLSVVMLEASPQKSLYSGLALLNLRVLPAHPSALVMCLSTLGVWWVLLLGSLFMSFNGFFLLGVAGLVCLTVFVSTKARDVLLFVGAVGLFLVGGESMLRNSSVIQTILGQSEVAFFLADGRFPTVVMFFVLAMLLSLVVQIEFWSLALALSLLLTNTIAFNGALGLVAGERVGRMIFFWWQSRSLNQQCRHMAAQFAGVSAVGAVVGLLIAGEVRTFLGLGFTSGLASFQEKSLQFVLLFALILAAQWMAQMIWGHFGAKAPVDEMQDSKYFGSHWKTWGLLSAPVMVWAREKVHKRHSEIRYHLQGLGTLKEGQVPAPIQARLKAEEEQLNMFLHDWQ
ncbi:hypothetical protein EZJ49_01380 [Bdellovibrio bacteriovorus]|uniref:hypothetical protein n=1 Tax=Bdellovibrio bacteriovorus TaxID=959 RepID=UPI0021D38FE5|nr:hypothetical protein [Bdellovibrio bacteriovorus]UXR64901.1 hypothetical protein EZJ49_01380 [Bdellovibrio bacteriovorus]